MLIFGLVLGFYDVAFGEVLAARQLVVVTAKGWNSRDGVLRAFERDSVSSPWRFAGIEGRVNLGKKGLGWGRGLLAPYPSSGPHKKEGDRRAPAGVFFLHGAFAYRPEECSDPEQFPCQPLSPATLCVDDARSTHYNRIIDAGAVQKDWTSAETMRSQGESYRLGVFIGHNDGSNGAPILPGAGSCIFFHVELRPKVATLGCTSMPFAMMQTLIRWLDEEKQPLLLQAPLEDLAPFLKPLSLPSAMIKQ